MIPSSFLQVLKAFVRWPEARVEAMREAVGRVHELRKLEESFANVRVEDKGLRALDEAVDVAVKRLKTVGPALEALQVRICVLRFLMSWQACGFTGSGILCGLY